ncbi:hypothetical protein J3R82DRAFT_3180 [Butyriboletus roseoflavus]|nr:hypothetical protein J3R82DRAFT_3180 [Butyriboletus roseoflavus]
MEVFSLPLLCVTLLAYLGTTSAFLILFPSVPVPLSSYFNNQAASIDGTTGNFDKNGSTYAAEYLPTGPWFFNGVTYDLPASCGSVVDNIIVEGQAIELPNATYVHELHLIYAGDGIFNLMTRLASTMRIILSQNFFAGKNWWRYPTLNWGDIRTPYHFVNYGASTNWNSSQIIQLSVSIALKSITLPQTADAPDRLHIFVISITPSVVPSVVPTGPELSIRAVQFSTRWEDVNGQRAQVIAITLTNLLPGSLGSSPKLTCNSIHWGIFSVPAYGPPKSYAEWHE